MPADFVDATMPCTSAHQMGTARMGADPATCVCDPNGESWDQCLGKVMATLPQGSQWLQYAAYTASAGKVDIVR